MANDAARFFADLSQIAGICADCGQIFRLSDSRPYRLTPPEPSIFDKLESEQGKIDRALERLNAMEGESREQARAAGLKQARRRLRKIDLVFDKLKLDPHDAKVVFDPVDFIVFDGMSRGKLRKLVLLARPPSTTVTDTLWQSIERTVEKGNFAFRTLRVSREGECSLG